MKVRLVSVPVGDQEIALKFYTEILGFSKKHDIPLGEGNRWLTVVSKDELDGPEVLLEPAPNHFPPAKVFQEELHKAVIPWTQFDVDNLDAEFDRLRKLGVIFNMEPTDVGTAKIAILDDTCGNKIQLVEIY